VQANLTRINFLKFHDETLLIGILAKNAHIGLTNNVLLGFLNQLRTCILLPNVTFLNPSMIDQLKRLEALVSDSGLFKAGREHEREHIKALIRVRMDQLNKNSIAWQECHNLLGIIK
jgi:hypothetical protein